MRVRGVSGHEQQVWLYACPLREALCLLAELCERLRTHYSAI